MLFYNFKNYDEFKQIFGIIEHGNGVKSRKNKILLSLYKDRTAFKRHVHYLSYKAMSDIRTYAKRHEIERLYDDKTKGKNNRRWREICRKANDRLEWYDFFTKNYIPLTFDNLPDLKRWLLDVLSSYSFRATGCSHDVYLNGLTFYSNLYETDDFAGLCEDGTVNAVRYVNVEKNRVYRMRAGKMFNHLLQCNIATCDMPEQIKRWLSEEWVGDWIQYATEKLGDNGLVLHVDDNFRDIYDGDCCKGYDDDSDCFHSCMVGDGQHVFYENYVSAKAAYLTDIDGMIVARCVIFTDVSDDDGNKYRLAERQYSYKSDLALQRHLISQLIRGGHIDGYKKVGASCHDATAFVDNQGNSLSDKHFSIPCSINFGDIMSYQDSFKWLDIDEHIAYNYEPFSNMVNLADTSRHLQGNNEDEDSHEYESWSEYNDEYIDNDDACYVETRDDYFYGHQTVYAHVLWNGRWSEEDCFEDDCVRIGDEYYYAGENCSEPYNYGIAECDRCGGYYLIDESLYSELTEGNYCCESCIVEAEEEWYEEHDYVQASDGEWYPSDEVIDVMEWTYKYVPFTGSVKTYVANKLHVDELDELIERGEATWYNGVAYIDDVGYDGEPVHIAAANLRAA